MKLLGVASLLLVAGCTATPNYCETFFYEHAYSNGYVELIELKRASCFNTTNHHDVVTGGGDDNHSNPTPASAAVSTESVSTSTAAVSTGSTSTGSTSTAAVSTGSTSTGSTSTGSTSTASVSTGSTSTEAVSASPGMPDAGYGIGHDAIGFEGGYTGGPVSFE